MSVPWAFLLLAVRCWGSPALEGPVAPDHPAEVGSGLHLLAAVSCRLASQLRAVVPRLASVFPASVAPA